MTGDRSFWKTPEFWAIVAAAVVIGLSVGGAILYGHSPNETGASAW